MRRRLTWLVVAITIAVAMGAGIYVAEFQRKTAPEIATNAIEHLFAAKLPDALGNPRPLEQWRGKILVINFWATWCPPCREEMPILSRLQTKHAGNGVQIVGIALDTAENVAQYAAMRPASYPLLTGDANATNLSRLLGNSQLALPYTVVFNRDGVTEMNRLGRFSEAELDSLLEKIVRR